MGMHVGATWRIRCIDLCGGRDADAASATVTVVIVHLHVRAQQNLTFLAVPLHSATKSLRLRIILMSLLKITTCFQQKSLAKISDVTIIFGSPSKHSLHSVITVLIHNSGHFGPPLPFWAPGPPALPGLPMASYATGKNTKRLKRKTRHN